MLAEILPADVWSVSLSIIGILLSLEGLWLVCRALWPAAVERAAERCERRGVACFFLGLLVTLIAVFVAIAVGRRLGAPGKILAYILLFFYLIMTGIGTSGFVTLIGRRLPSPIDAAQPWRVTVRGGIALELAWLIPLFGWVGILPISLIIGCGASFMGIFTGRGSRSQAVPAPVEITGLHASGVLQ